MTLPIKFANYAFSTLAVGCDSAATSLSVPAGHGARFPALAAGEYFYATLENAALNREIVKVTARVDDTLTVLRAQDNTTARSWNAGDSVSLRVNAAAFADVSKAVNHEYTPAGTGAVATTVQSKLRETVSAKDFGAVGDGVTDDTAAIQAAINATAGGKLLYIPSGTYRISSQITKAQSFTCPTIVGEGAASTIFDFGAPIGLKIKGGSGSLCGAVISGIQFTGLTTTTLVQVADQCGVTFKECRFSQGAIGLDLFNESSGGFTEFVVAENCDFTEWCVEALVYRRASGTDSFHGSGLRNCTINEASGATLPKIRIGGAGSSSNDIVVYNAPFSFQVWKRTTNSVLVNNTTRTATNFHGNITLELFGAATGANWKFCNDTRSTYLLGTISSLQDKTERGTLILCDTFETRTDGAVNALLKPYRINSSLMVSGANSITSIPSITTETYLVRLRFADDAGPARKVYLLAVNFDATGVNTVTTIAQLQDYFGGSMPYPTFSMSGNTLVATATFATTVRCTGTVTKIGIGEAFGL